MFKGMTEAWELVRSLRVVSLRLEKAIQFQKNHFELGEFGNRTDFEPYSHLNFFLIARFYTPRESRSFAKKKRKV